MTALLGINLAVIGGMMMLLWIVSVPRRNASIVDLFWGAGFVLIALSCSWQLAATMSNVDWLIVAMVIIWGLRLSAYLTLRNLGKPEDYRYAAMREKVGPSFWIVSLLLVFGLQGLIMFVVSLPISFGTYADGSFSGWHIVGGSIWLLGFLSESIGDWQMSRFKANPENRGQVMNRGLWRYTRHPNYFGDFLVWWGIWTTAWAGGAPGWTVISPILMSFLLIRVSGVALLERHLAKRLDGYEQYLNETNSFFPWFPSRSESPSAS